MYQQSQRNINMADFVPAATQVSDIRFGNIDIFYNKQLPSQVIFTKMKSCNNNEEYELTQAASAFRYNLQHTSLLKMVDLNSDKPNLKIYVTFEYPSDDLFARLEHLKDPQELLKFMYQILSVLSLLEKHQMIHGNVRPEFIFYHEKNCNYVILDRLGDNNGPLEAMMESLNNGHLNFIPPSIFEELSRGNLKVNQNPFKIETFCLGMILMSVFVGTSNMQSIYDTKQSRFDCKIFEDCCEKVRNFFDQNLVPIEIWEFVSDNLLSLNQSGRSTPTEAFCKLNQLLYLLQEKTEEIQRKIETESLEGLPAAQLVEMRSVDHYAIPEINSTIPEKKESLGNFVGFDFEKEFAKNTNEQTVNSNAHIELPNAEIPKKLINHFLTRIMKLIQCSSFKATEKSLKQQLISIKNSPKSLKVRKQMMC